MHDTDDKARRILIADDDPVFAQLLSEMLQLGGWAPLGQIAYSGQEAVDLYKQLTSAPNVVILDYHMPPLGGLGAAQLLRALPGGEELAMIILTGFPQDIPYERAAELGVRVLQKGTEDFPDELLQVLRDLG